MEDAAPEQPEEAPPPRPLPLRFKEKPENTSSLEKPLGQPAGKPVATGMEATAAATASFGMARLEFYPKRFPVALGQEGSLVVVLDAGAAGVDGPLHFAYDPGRLEVLRVEGGHVQTAEGIKEVQVTHTPVLGWITASFPGTATGTATLLKLVVQPKSTGELPLIFAGPIGAVLSENATVVGVPAAALERAP